MKNHIDYEKVKYDPIGLNYLFYEIIQLSDIEKVYEEKTVIIIIYGTLTRLPGNPDKHPWILKKKNKWYFDDIISHPIL